MISMGDYSYNCGSLVQIEGYIPWLPASDHEIGRVLAIPGFCFDSWRFTMKFNGKGPLVLSLVIKILVPKVAGLKTQETAGCKL